MTDIVEFYLDINEFEFVKSTKLTISTPLQISLANKISSSMMDPCLRLVDLSKFLIPLEDI